MIHSTRRFQFKITHILVTTVVAAVACARWLEGHSAHLSGLNAVEQGLLLEGVRTTIDHGICVLVDQTIRAQIRRL